LTCIPRWWIGELSKKFQLSAGVHFCSREASISFLFSIFFFIDSPDTQMSEEEKKAAAEAAEKRAAAANGGMGMAPFLILILAFAAYMYMKNQKKE
jgi:hypothetical protein